LAVTATVESNPGTTAITSSAFNPCTSSTTGSTWTITDAKDGKTYKIKKMADGRYWMVQNLMFGTCNANTWVDENSAADATKSPTIATGYVGHCKTVAAASEGYLYNAAAMLQTTAVWSATTSSTFSCSGTTTAANACGGLCPAGFHIPTIDEFTSADAAFKSAYNCSNYACYNSSSQFEGQSAGWCYANGSYNGYGQITYWSSTIKGNNEWYVPLWGSNWNTGLVENAMADEGASIRCVRNY
jgi:uncharacterized protein (TIGR02145 family)